MQNNIYFYYDNRSLNEATEKYIEIVKDCFISDYSFHYINDFSGIKLKKNDLIFTITSLYYIKAKIRYPFNKQIFWAQGINPEEYLMHKNKKDYKYFFKRVIERIAIKNSFFNFFVSESMLNHYINKYNYKKNNYFIMPCFNIVKRINKDYEKIAHSFVYAGNLAKWQCIEQTIKIFKEYQNIEPSAQIKFFVKDRVTLEKLLNNYKINNYSVDFVSLDCLQDELLYYKYGFIIRENNIVNYVSTPTKMNSYLSSMVIPIVTDVIGDFNTKLNDYNNVLIINHNMNEKFIAKEIHNYDKYNKVNINDFDSIFNDYYSLKKYKVNLKKKINDFFYNL